MKKLLLLKLALILLLAIPATTVFAQDISPEAEQHILNELTRAQIPNAAVAVIQNGEVSYILKDSAHDTLFRIGSIGKSMTGFGILLLEDMGLLSVTDPVNQHLPWFEVRYNGDPVPHSDITIYNLLHHTSGLTSDERRFPSTIHDLSKDEVTAQLTGIELAFYPSTTWEYGNVNFVILGFIIEAVSGQSYDEFMTQQVLHPLGMYNTFMDAERARATGRTAPGGHRYGFLRPRPVSAHISTVSAATGGQYSSISDMARWAGIHLGTVEVDEQFARVVQRSHMHHHASDAPFEGAAMFGDDLVYTAGFMFFESGAFGHGGSTLGDFSDLMMFPERGTAVVVLSNLRLLDAPAWTSLALEAADGGVLARVGMDPFLGLDIIFLALAAIGLWFIVLLVRLAIKSSKKLRDGENMRSKLRITWLIAPILAILGLLIINFAFSVMFSNSVELVRLIKPASWGVATAAVWVMFAYSICSLLFKLFIRGEKEKKTKKVGKR